jgi:hypothetical protein
MRYQVRGKLGKRSRFFHLDAPDDATARRSAVQLVNGWYATHSGALGNQIWSQGTVVVRKDGREIPIPTLISQ